MGKKHSKLRSSSVKNNMAQVPGRAIHHDSMVTALNVSADKLVSTDDKGMIMYFSLIDHSLINKWKNHERGVTQVHLKNDSTTCFTASRDKTIKVTNVLSKTIQHIFTGHSLAVTGLSVNSDYTCLVSGSRDCTVKLWDVETGANLKTNMVSRNIVTDIRFIENENLIVQCSEDKIMKLWDSRSLKNVSNFPAKQYFQTCCDIYPARSQILTGSTGCNANGCEVILWDMRQLKAIYTMKEHSEKVTSCKFFNENIAVSVSHDCSIKIWDLSLSKCIDTEFIHSAKELTSLDINHTNDSICVGTFHDGIHVLQYDASLRKSTPLFQL